ncbi:MAG: Crp/Fnr family transcriptional regulator [Desulfobacteraceae bacterium]|nr:Crp/Fnr family transcriptional regulator [Desulfobacteraceae bacterium]
MSDNNQKKASNCQILKTIPFFASLTEEELWEMASQMTTKKVKKNQVVLFEEDTQNYMYVIYSGKVRVVQINEEGREQILTIHKKKDYFGEMALLDGKTSPATIIAMEESEIGLLGRDDFYRFIETNSNMRKQIISTLCTELREAWMMVRIMSYDNAEQRILGVFDRLKDLYGVTDQRGVIISLKLTHSQIANYASVTRETVTRTLKKLECNGAIQMQENKCILLRNPLLSGDGRR